MKPPSVQRASFITLIVLVTIAFLWLLLPYYGAVLWAVILTILFNPLQRWLTAKLNQRRGYAALGSLLVCVCIVVIPGVIIIGLLAAEAASLYQRLSSQQIDFSEVFNTFRENMPDFVNHALEGLQIGSLEDIQQRVTSLLASASQTIATRLVSVGQDTLQFTVSLGVMLYVLFFLFRDGPEIVNQLRRSSPLDSKHTEYIASRFASAVKATVKGNLIIALVQGAIGGVTLWFMGVEAALLLGVVMAVLSLLPAVGAALVWGPVAVYFFMTGDYLKGVLLIGIGVFVIGLVDNLLRPPLVGKDLRMPDYMVLVSTLGGLALFGINGFVIGPLIAALFIAVWSLFSGDDPPDRSPAD
ncbi:AI-2E family transporter [Haematobacter missouriensis]|uniref:AI-2E family transporter n=1 Tax=Haematobacter missouriensis TaxID=366616 RepID=A0A212AMZ1_9RHOB|nr:AI-2E family transporter [Haematobacter missouriensis]OWJ82829.1 AI-2E family transporter [Haematobacter missouriensis]